MKKYQAFSLIELSAVIIIISIITIGLISAKGLIKSSRLANARSTTAESIVPKIDNLIVWHETSSKNSFSTDQALDGAQISAWHDISPSSIIAQKNSLVRTASSAITYEENGINDLPSVKFNGNGILTTSTNFFYQGYLSQRVTFFAVIRPNKIDSSTQQIIADSSDGTELVAILNNKVNLYNTSTGTSTNSAQFSIQEDYIICVYYNYSGSKVFVNSFKNMIGGAALNVVTQNSRRSLIVGGNNSHTSDSQTFNGLMSEVILYNKILTAEERKGVMTYLAKKYSINLD